MRKFPSSFFKIRYIIRVHITMYFSCVKPTLYIYVLLVLYILTR